MLSVSNITIKYHYAAFLLCQNKNLFSLNYSCLARGKSYVTPFDSFSGSLESHCTMTNIASFLTVAKSVAIHKAIRLSVKLIFCTCMRKSL